ncbi:MAG: DUF1186 domain-containing protein [Flavimaricola sp.]|nr:DUF1186 domain-containing protein [Flavimaricola sp.]
MTPDEIMRDLERHDIFPKAAMAAAGQDRETMVPVFLELVDRLGSQKRPEMQEEAITALIPIFHMLGEFREPRAYRPLLKLMRQPTTTLDYLLGDAITETGFRVIAGTFDGDLKPLFEFIEDESADAYARSSMLDALVLIAQVHPEQRTDVLDYFRSFRDRCPEENSDLLIGWVDGLVDLGLSDMEPEIRATFDAGLIPKEYCSFDEIQRDLALSAETGRVPGNERYQRGLIMDAIAELSSWHGYSDAYLARQKSNGARNAARAMPWAETFMYETTPVGRNDPCPCGSGKKFKKCCLQ